MGQLGRLIVVLVPAVLVATPRAQVPKDPAFDVVAVKPAADPTALIQASMKALAAPI